MLEGSSAELAVLSQPSSPRHQQQPRSGASSWLLPSAASTRPATPRNAAGTTAAAGLVPWQPQLLQQQLAQQPSRFSRAASCAAAPGSSTAGESSLPHAVSLPLPAWPAAEQVPPAPADCDEQQTDALQQRSSQDASGGHTRRTLRCSSTVSLSGWQPPAEAAAPVEAEASSSGGGVQQPQQQVPQQQGAGEALGTSRSSTLPVAAAWAPGYIAAAAAASAPAKQQQQQQLEPPRVSLGACRSGTASGTVTPRLCSLSNLGMVGAAADGSPQVTPRARSLRAAASQQVSLCGGGRRGRCCSYVNQSIAGACTTSCWLIPVFLLERVAHAPSLTCRCHRFLRVLTACAAQDAARALPAWRGWKNCGKRRPPVPTG